jgi:hypothetical protein
LQLRTIYPIEQTMFESHRDILALWPTLVAFAEAINAPYESTAKWKQRDRIPSEWWRRTVRASQRCNRKVTLEDLARIDERRIEAA